MANHTQEGDAPGQATRRTDSNALRMAEILWEDLICLLAVAKGDAKLQVSERTA